ncbi:nicotinamide riboside transporter PnuC [Roseivirga sp. BDSF3-8]|uniref:nicotinamide riboside transporter PnuC n=1 Tax=Roseivirga sp. BDSF3-8 TaxID=3241598 RepID=UPI003531B3EF
MNFEAISQAIAKAASAMTWVEAVAVVLGLLYLILASRESLWCWPAALLSVCLYIYICLNAKLYSETGLQFFYLAMAIYGWYSWKNGSQSRNEELPITVWPLRYHIVIILAGSLITILAGYIMDNQTDAALPYMDAFTTVFSVITTIMVTRKVLENWLYWIIIDGVGVYMYFQRELFLTSLLFLIYVGIVIYGYFDWQKRMQTATA